MVAAVGTRLAFRATVTPAVSRSPCWPKHGVTAFPRFQNSKPERDLAAAGHTTGHIVVS